MPLIVDVSHPVFGQGGEVVFVEEVFVPNLDAVLPVSWKLCKKAIESRDEVSTTFKVFLIEVWELKDEHAHFLSHGLERSEEGALKKVSVEKVFVELTGTRSVAGESCEMLGGDFLCDLERESKVVRNLNG